MSTDFYKQAVASQRLPTQVRERGQWEALGFTFGPAFADDELFCPATFPEGWSVQPIYHTMWNIVDAAGNKRGSYFYKASFYGRSAIMQPPEKRYRVEVDFARCGQPIDYNGSAYKVEDAVTGGTVWESGLWVCENADERVVTRHAVEERQRADAEAWLDEHFPAWRDPAAYWPAASEAG